MHTCIMIEVKAKDIRNSITHFVSNLQGKEKKFQIKLFKTIDRD